MEARLVDYVAMDIKNCLSQYHTTTGLKHLDTQNIMLSLDILKNSGIDYELRTTIVKELHSTAGIEAMAKELQGTKKLFLQIYTKNKYLN